MKKLYLLLFTFLVYNTSQAQININLINVEEWVKKNFVGQGVVIGNIKTNLAAKESIGAFSNNGILQLKSGLVLSTGDVRRIPGLNDKHNESTGFNNSGKPEEDADLQKILKANFYDISYIEFDFVPYNNSIQFNYQFGSDEYPEYVGSAFNDVFAFIVSDGEKTTNIALIPGKNTPVSINTVNYKTDSIYFINNNVFTFNKVSRDDPSKQQLEIVRSGVGKILFAIKKFFSAKAVDEGDLFMIEPNQDLIKKVNERLYKNLQYDGITTKLPAQIFVEPYKKYHLKIIIADVSDNIYDSAVFLEQGSFSTKKDITQPSFVDYPDLSKQIDAKRILNGEKLQDILPQKEEIKDQVKVNKSSVLDEINSTTIYFDFDKAAVADVEMDKIKFLVKTYENLGKGYSVEVTGHTDNKGSLKYNLELSAKRSAAVVECLKSISPSMKNILIANKAYLLPAKDNISAEGRAKNRRVEVKFIKVK